MSKKQVCDPLLCSGCGACVISCPKKCISLVEDRIGALIAEINDDECVNCNICIKACHINKEKKFVFPQRVFAAWSKDETIRSEAASGGIASEIMKYAIKNNYFIMGTRFYRTNGVCFDIVKSLSDLIWARNSKYVYSNMQNCFREYANKVKFGIKSIFIGLPCQVSALKSYLQINNFKEENIVFVEIICHGIPPFKYFDEHLKYIEKNKVCVDKIRFRNPNNEYLLQCYTAEGTLLYKRGMHEDDTYYRAFALNLNFRESCYKCQYARSERISDLTIGDYSGLGLLWPYNGDGNQASVILCNTEKGYRFLTELSNNDQIKLISRPLAEPYSAIGNPQLRHPAAPFFTRDIFVKEYMKTNSYEKAAKVALNNVFLKYYLVKPFLAFVRIMRKITPKSLKSKIKELIKKF